MNLKEASPVFAPNLPSQWAFLAPMAKKLGFVAIGVAPAGPVPEVSRRNYEGYLGQGYHGEMSYLERYLDERWDVRTTGMLGGANVVIVAALAYGSGAIEDGFWRHVASYARGTDYHLTLRHRLKELSLAVGERFAGSRHRVCVDTAPVMERSWALLAGIGELLKNGMVMVPDVGPRVVLGEILCAGVPPVDPMTPKVPFGPCENCTLCLEACPTAALRAPAELDSRRCLSYWTIENRKDPLPAGVEQAVESVFGCEKCITCCPYDNPGMPTAILPPSSARKKAVRVTELVDLDDDSIQALVRETPLERTGPWALRRNTRAFFKNTDR